MFTGSARLVQEARDQAQSVTDQLTSELQQRGLEQEQANLKGQVEAIAKRLEGIGTELKIIMKRDTDRLRATAKERLDLGLARKMD